MSPVELNSLVGTEPALQEIAARRSFSFDDEPGSDALDHRADVVVID